ncbi:tetratricopeptide repeat protein [[Phormidium] sp. ETS-05]|uniref:CHAT domain-containing protein n=1 Tax=[Phormidium] sp. ETS-05 TaxID=222819 RepID=UPI0018EEEACB|nr:CHAT domain-containing tetratricopeptide repeat protein [[Phormidium] sp. ETS-05]
MDEQWQKLNQQVFQLYNQGRYAEAVIIAEKALNLALSLYKGDNSNVAQSLNNLAALYDSQGCYEQAKPLYEEALAMTKRLFKGDHPDVARSLNNLALLYQSQGRYKQAEPRLKKVLRIFKNRFGGDHPDVARSLNNLALLYQSQGRYKQAEPRLKKVLRIFKNRFGGDHPDVARSLSNLAGLYQSQGHYEKAKPLLKKALRIFKNRFGGDHPDVARSLSNLAEFYQSQGHYEKAEPLYEKALAMRKRLFQGDHPNVASSLNNLATLMVQTNRPTEALELMKQATEVEDKIISLVFGFSSERDRLAHLERNRDTFYTLLSLVLNHLQDSPTAVQTALDVVFKRKALSAAAQAAFSEAIHSGRYPHLMPQFQQLRSLSDQIIKIYHSQPEPGQLAAMSDRLIQLQGEYDHQLERQLAAQVPEIQLQQQLASRQAVALELPAGSTLVEFVWFRVYDFTAPIGGKWQPASYVAFVLPAQQPDAVQMIDLGAAEPIDKLIKVFRQSASLNGDNFLGNRLNMWGEEAETASPFLQYDATTGVPLRPAIFDPIRPAINHCQSLRIAPDWDLNLLPFQILPSDDKGEKLLMDEYNISYLSAGRDVLRSTVQPNRPAGAPLVVADPDFDLGLESNGVGDTHLEKKPFKRAPGTRYLGESVAKKLNAAALFDKNALEPRLTSSNCPRILLIATHGVFWPESQDAQRARMAAISSPMDFSRKPEREPMISSGLALAGANTSLLNQPLPPEVGKGLVFAQDVAALDLWANELTVLSACETGIGDVKIGEGVFGLRRAFAFAGAKTLLMSLWSVDDKPTALLMNRFFDNLRDGLGRADALAEAQNYLRNVTVAELRQLALGQEILAYLLPQNNPDCQEDDTPLSHPFYWGAWVCQGDTTGFDW